MSRLPREAREGLMRAWLEILRERHPEVAWIPVEQGRNIADDTTRTPRHEACEEQVVG
jgi:hypothetical protein